MDNLLRNPNSKWIIPIATGLVACICICVVLYCVGSIAFQDLAGISQTRLQQMVNRGDPQAMGAIIWVFSMCCCPLALMLMVGGGSYMYVNNYQKNNPPEAPAA